MFSDYLFLTSLNLSNFKTNSVNIMDGIFYDLNKMNCKLICNDIKILRKYN